MSEPDRMPGPNGAGHSPRLRPEDVGTQDDLRNYLIDLMSARRSIRAVESDTGVSKTTLGELRKGERRPSRDVVTKIVGRYAPAELAAAEQAWAKVQPTPVTALPPPEQRLQSAPGTSAGPAPDAEAPWSRPPPLSDPDGVPAAGSDGVQHRKTKLGWFDLRALIVVLIAVVLIQAGLLIVVVVTRPPPPPGPGNPPPWMSPGPGASQAQSPPPGGNPPPAPPAQASPPPSPR